MRRLKLSPGSRASLRVLLSHYVTNGITAGLGFLFVSIVVDLWLGPYASALATTGVIATTPPDVVGPRRGKFRAMLPSVIFGLPVFWAVQSLNGRHLEQLIVITLFSFMSFLAMAWGKRGVPVAMGMMFTAIFSVATNQSGTTEPPLINTLYFGIGA